MRATAPGTGTFAERHPESDVAALERLDWLRASVVLPSEQTSSRRWVAPVAAAVLVGVLVGLLFRGDPPAADTRLGAAYEAQQAGDLDRAAVLYADVVTEEPDNVVAQFNLGVINHMQGDVSGAAERYEAAIAADPAYAPALFNLAVLRTETDRTAAIGLYRRLLAVEPSHVDGMFNLGLLLLEDGAAVEASALLDRAIELDPSLQGD